MPSVSCPNCHAPLPDDAAACPHCGGDSRPEPTATVPTPAAAVPPTELEQLGPYRLLGVLGRGGMGVVYRAEDPALKRQVAIKVMLPEFAARPADKARFLREARAAAAVEHDHVVPIFQVAEDRGTPFLAMPLLKGRTLAEELKQSPRPAVSEVVRIGREIAEGLAAAHARGLIHRDVKPGNVWLEGDRRRVKILDFGLVREVGEPDAEAGSRPDRGDGPDLTKTGAVIGTPGYMSPEQAYGWAVDARSDLFSLGVVLYRMATGRPPFAGATPQDLIAAVTATAPRPPAALAPDLPPALNALTVRLLARIPDDRPASAAAVADELRQIELGLTAGVRAIPLGPAPSPFADLADTVTVPDAPVSRAAGRGGRDRARGAVWGLLGLLVLGGAGLLTARVVEMTTPRGADRKEPVKAPVGAKPPTAGTAKPAPPDGPAFFNGTDLTGWDAGTRGEWKVVDGAIVGFRDEAVRNSPVLRTEKSYTDFELSFRVRWPSAQQGYLQFVYRQPDDLPERRGCVRFHPQGIYPGTGRARAPLRAGEFNDLTVRCVGRRVRVVTNGVTLMDGEADVPAEGRFGFQYIGGLAGEVVIRDIRFTDLGRPADPERTVAEAVIARGGWVEVSPPDRSTAPRVVRKKDDLPAWDFRVEKIECDVPRAFDAASIEALRPAGSVWGVRMVNGALTRSGLKSLATFPAAESVTEVILIGPEYTSESLAALSAFGRVRSLTVSGSPGVTDAGLKHVRKLTGLTSLALEDSGVTDAGLAELKDLPLGVLKLRGCKDVNDAGLARLAGTRTLTELDLRTRVTDAAVKKLAAALPTCRIAWAGGVLGPTPAADPDRAAAAWVVSAGGSVGMATAAGFADTEKGHPIPAGPFTVATVGLRGAKAVGDDDLRRLAGLRELTTLLLDGTAVTDAGLAHLADCRKLDSVFLGGLPVTAAGLGVLKGAPIRRLSVERSRVTDDAVPLFATFDRMDELYLSGCGLTDAGLKGLHGLTTLRVLHLHQTKVTAAGVAAAGAALPGCRIEWDGGTVGPTP